MEPARPEREPAALGVACLLVAAAALVWSVWAVDYIPTNDGPEHVLQGHIENHYSDPGTVYAKQLAPAPQYAARGFAMLFVPLEQVLPWKSALKVALSLIVLLATGGFALLTTALHRDRLPAALLGSVLALSWPLYMGFFPFALGMAFGWCVVAFVVLRSMSRRQDWILLFALLTLNTVLHVVSALLTLAVVGFVLLLRPSHERLPRRAGKVALAGAPILAALTLLAVNEQGRVLPIPLRWEAPATWLREAPRLVLPGPSWRALAVVALLAVALVACGAHLRRGGTAHRDERALFLAATGLVALGALLPFDLPGWEFFSPRLLVLGATLGLALLPVERLTRRGRRTALFAFTVASVLSAWVSARMHRRIADGCADAHAALELPIRREYVQLPVTFQQFCGVPPDPAVSEVPHMAPLRHVAALYATSHGGTLVSMFQGNPSIHAFVAREFDDLPVPEWLKVGSAARVDPQAREVALAYFAGYGAFYESLLLFGVTPSDIERVLARGYQAEVRRDSFLMARFRGCPVDLVIQNARAAGRLALEHGVWPVTTALRSSTLVNPRAGADGALNLRLDRTACGALWTRVSWLEGDRTHGCAGATDQRVLVFEARGPRTVVECVLEAPSSGE